MEEGKVLHSGMLRAVLAILQWWSFNVTVVIMNKWIFQYLDFRFPLTVSCIHFVCSAVGAYISVKVIKIKPLIEVKSEDRWRKIFPMSFVFCINIVLGNVSLRYIPVSFMQTVKSFTPATTVILQWLIWSKVFEWRVWVSLLPIVGGILLTTITELSFNAFGFCAALFGCIATSTKTILAESLLHGYKFDSINTVYYMAPFATMILTPPAIFLEGSGVVDWLYSHQSICSSLIIIFSSGVLAFCLNFSIFYVIQSTTAVTFNVAGNLKVAVAVLVSWLIFRNPVSALNIVGCAVTLSGCTFYGEDLLWLKTRSDASSFFTWPRTVSSSDLSLLKNEREKDLDMMARWFARLGRSPTASTNMVVVVVVEGRGKEEEGSSQDMEESEEVPFVSHMSQGPHLWLAWLCHFGLLASPSALFFSTIPTLLSPHPLPLPPSSLNLF